MKARQDAILFLSRNNALKELLRKKINHFKDSVLLNKISLVNIAEYNIRVIILDEQTDYSHIKEIDCKNIIVVINNKSQETYNRIFENGIYHILEVPINENLLCSILLKSFGLLQDRSSRKIKYHGLTLDLESNFAIYKDCKVNLTPKEADVLHHLITKEKQLSLSARYLQVVTSRINRKFKTCTDTKIIRSRYGYGYYLAI